MILVCSGVVDADDLALSGWALHPIVSGGTVPMSVDESGPPGGVSGGVAREGRG